MFRGSIVALVTPLLPSGEVDFDLLDKLVDWHIEQGTNAIVAMGTTGESGTLTENEHLSVVARVVKRSQKKIPVIAGTGSSSTAKAIHLTQSVEKLGVDATLCVTPYYVRPTQQGLYQHFTAIADAATKPVILYNVPSRTGCDLLPETVIALSAHADIVGIKEATGLIDRVALIKNGAPDSFIILSGDDASCCEFMTKGGNGVISVTANVAPKSMAKMCKLALSGQYHEARELDETLQGLHKDLFVEPNPTPAKWAVHQIHGGQDVLRLPLLPLTSAGQTLVLAAMKRAGVVK